MKIPKEVRVMPWPEPFAGNPKQQFRVTVAFPVVNHERLMVVTFSQNVNEKYRDKPRDCRIVCSKKQGSMAVLYKGSTNAMRKPLRDAVNIYIPVCYPEISERDERAMANWLGERFGESRNHLMPELAGWVDRAISAEVLRERDARGELRDEDVELCPEELPEGIVDYIRRTVLPEDDTLIYRKGNTRGICYSCCQEVRAREQRFRQNEIVKCPNCGAKVTCYLDDGSSFKAEFVQNIASIQKGKDGKTLFVRQWHIRRDPTARWDDIRGQLEEVCRYAMRGNHGAKWQIEAKDNWFMNCSRYYLKDWQRVDNLSEVYDGTYYFYCPDSWREILDGTSLEYCNLEGYIDAARAEWRRNPIRFLMDWARYPMVEKLWKAGYTQLIHERIQGVSQEQRNAVYWGRNSFREAFAFPVRLLKLHKPEEWTMRDVKKVKELWGCVLEGKLREAELQEFVMAMVDFEHIRDAIGHASVHRILKYVSGQVEKERERQEKEREEAKRKGRTYYTGGLETPETYRDYLKDCVKLHLNLDDSAVLFPANLNAAHARTISMVKHKASEISREKFAKETERLKWMEWERDGLLIRLPVDGAELIAEGKYLHHCVGGYAERMANGKTTILLIRRAEDPDTPFYTLEWLEGRVQQCRTMRNQSYTEDETVKAFVDDWVEQVATKGKRKKKAASVA